MAARRDQLLQQLGITQWTLRRPSVLQGEIAVNLPSDTRLVIVAAQPPLPTDPLISDVLRSLSLTQEQVYTLTPEQTAMLPASPPCPSWCLGIEAPLPLTGIQFTSPTLAELYANASAKRALWQQIGEHLSLSTQNDAAHAETRRRAD